MCEKCLIIGPQPPAIGGISSIISLIRNGINSNNIFFISTNKPERAKDKIFWPLYLFFKIYFFCLFKKPKRVLLFSSENMSFWEKCIWCKLISFNGGLPCMVMVAGPFPEFFSNLSEFQKKLAVFFVKKVKIVTQSNYWAEYYRSIFPDSEIEQISGGVDTDFFCPSIKEKEIINSQQYITVLFLGWIIKEKGILDLLESIYILTQKKGVKYIRLRLVGPVYMDSTELVNVIERYGISEYVEIVGPINSKDLIRNEFNSADIFVFPSLYEGFPVALLEAVSSGLPCVGTEVGGIPDILINEENGLIVPPKSPEKLADALSLLIGNEEMRIRMGNYSRKHALKNYTYSSCLQSYKSILGINDK